MVSTSTQKVSSLPQKPLPIIEARRRPNADSRTPTLRRARPINKRHRLRPSDTTPLILRPFVLEDIITNTQIPFMLSRSVALVVINLAVLPPELQDARTEVDL